MLAHLEVKTVNWKEETVISGYAEVVFESRRRRAKESVNLISILK